MPSLELARRRLTKAQKDYDEAKDAEFNNTAALVVKTMLQLLAFKIRTGKVKGYCGSESCGVRVGKYSIWRCKHFAYQGENHTGQKQTRVDIGIEGTNRREAEHIKRLMKKKADAIRGFGFYDVQLYLDISGNDSDHYTHFHQESK